jgi:hypothetical protein
LIDWDDLKVAPRERDLWFYEFAPLIAEYSRFVPRFEINHDLCSFYRTQRFLEDLRIYIENDAQTVEQAKANVQFFCHHWSWEDRR